MTFKSGSLKIIVTLMFVTAFRYRKSATDANRLLNLIKTHKLRPRSLLFPPTAPTRVQRTYAGKSQKNQSQTILAQFIGGIGIPVEDLHFESVTSGYVLKAEYFLPETADKFRQKLKPQTIHRRRKNINEINFYDQSFNNASSFNEIKERKYSNQTSSLKQKQKQQVHINHFHSTMDDNLMSQQNHGAVYRWLLYKAIEMVLNKSALNGHACMLRSICEHAAIPLGYEGGLLSEIIHIILTPSLSQDASLESNYDNYRRAEHLGRAGKNCGETFRQCLNSPMDIISAVFET